jgi:hypothetical protein
MTRRKTVAAVALAGLVAFPLAALAVSPVDESGQNAPSAPKVNGASPSNEATGESSKMQGSGTSMPSSGSGSATSGTTQPGAGSSSTTGAMPSGHDSERQGEQSKEGSSRMK